MAYLGGPLGHGPLAKKISFGHRQKYENMVWPHLFVTALVARQEMTSPLWIPEYVTAFNFMLFECHCKANIEYNTDTLYRGGISTTAEEVSSSQHLFPNP